MEERTSEAGLYKAAQGRASKLLQLQLLLYLRPYPQVVIEADGVIAFILRGPKGDVVPAAHHELVLARLHSTAQPLHHTTQPLHGTAQQSRYRAQHSTVISCYMPHLLHRRHIGPAVGGGGAAQAEYEALLAGHRPLHTYMHTYIHTYMHAYIHAYMHDHNVMQRNRVAERERERERERDELRGEGGRRGWRGIARLLTAQVPLRCHALSWKEGTAWRCCMRPVPPCSRHRQRGKQREIGTETETERLSKR